MALRNWPNINLIPLQANSNKEFRCYTLLDRHLRRVTARYGGSIKSSEPSRSHMGMNIFINTWHTLSMALEFRVSIVEAGRKENMCWSPYINESTIQLAGTRSWNTVVKP